VLTAAALGFALGLRHAFDPDHVIAVSTIVSRHRNAWQAAWIGVSWGLGHSLTILAVGALVIALRVAIPDGAARALEGAVGVVLIALGAANLWAAAPSGAGAGAAPGGEAGPGTLRAALARSGLVGLVHGLAGSAGVAILALAAMPTPGAAVVYLGVFGLGTVAGMAAFSLALGAPFALLRHRPGARRLVTAVTGAVSLGFGTWLLYGVSVLGGLGGLA
jgi:high-affinity nickel-transport protein